MDWISHAQRFLEVLRRIVTSLLLVATYFCQPTLKMFEAPLITGWLRRRYSRRRGGSTDNDDLRFAFDGDAVLFSDASERIFKERGLEAFTENEKAAAHTPLDAGPFKGFLQALHGLQSEFSAYSCPIRTALVTARAAPSHERVVRTLRDWNVRIDESLFLGGLSKGDFLNSFGADVFFDDQQTHCSSAREYVATGHVPHGVSNE